MRKTDAYANEPTPIWDAVAASLSFRPGAPGVVMRHPLPTFANTKPTPPPKAAKGKP